MQVSTRKSKNFVLVRGLVDFATHSYTENKAQPAGSTVTKMASREHHRARIRLPVRLRRTTPFGQKIELCETIDVSRGGLLLSTRESHSAGVPLWVTFPYDSSLPDGQPELLARVVRCDELPKPVREEELCEIPSSTGHSPRERTRDGRRIARVVVAPEVPPTCALAVRFEAPRRSRSNGNGAYHGSERRSSPRRLLAIPIRVRPERVPWFEETMTLDFSSRGMRFRSQREYTVGEPLRIALQDEASAPWNGAKEIRATVARVSPVDGGVALDVGVCRAP